MRSRALSWSAFGDDSGVSAVVVAVVVVVLFGFLALAVDVGRLYEERRELQRTADVSALSGAQRLMAGKAEAVATGQEYVTLNPSVNHSAYDEVTDDVVAQRVGEGDPGCLVEGVYYDCVEVTVRDRAFEFYFARALSEDLTGIFFDSDNPNEAVGAHATAVVGAGAPGGEKLVPWVVIDCPDPTYDGTGSDPVSYGAIAAAVEAEYPGRCPYTYSTAGWNGPRENLFLDTPSAVGGNFQAADLAKEPCPPPSSADGLFPKSAGAGANDYKDLLAGEATTNVIPCNIGKGARVYPKTGIMVGPTSQGLNMRGVSPSTCMNEASFNATVQDPDGDGVYQVLNHHNPCLVALLLAVHVDPDNGAVTTDVPGAGRIIEFQHPDAVDSDGDDDWRFARPDNGASKPMVMRRFAAFYITNLGGSRTPYQGVFLRISDSANAELDGTPCTERDGICVVKLRP